MEYETNPVTSADLGRFAPPQAADYQPAPEACGDPEETLPAALLSVLIEANRVVILATMRGSSEKRLTPAKFRILNYIHETPGASLAQVAAHLGVRMPTASVMLLKLQTEGLVLRERHPASRRRLALMLTPSGLDTITSARAALFQRLLVALQMLCDDERQSLIKAVSALDSFLLRTR